MILAIVVLGGLGSQIGVVFAAFVMIGGIELLRNLSWLKTIFGDDFDPSNYRHADLRRCRWWSIMVWRPRGLVSSGSPSVCLEGAEGRLRRAGRRGPRMSALGTIDPILTVEHLTMRFGGLVAIDDLSFTVGRGDITALIGPNGAGKTTVFNCITGFYKPTEGRIAIAHRAGRVRRARPVGDRRQHRAPTSARPLPARADAGLTRSPTAPGSPAPSRTSACSAA